MAKPVAGDNIVGETKATIEVEHAVAGATVQQTSVEENLGIEIFKTTPAVVSYKQGRTVNLGNFNSLRIDVGISVPCYREEIDDAYALAKIFTSERLTQLLAEEEKSRHTKKHEAEHSF